MAWPVDCRWFAIDVPGAGKEVYKMVRFAAVGDIHCKKDSAGQYRALFA
jgi:hypothetical protein